MGIFKEQAGCDTFYLCPRSLLSYPAFRDPEEIERLFDNEDREGFYIRFIKPTRPVNPNTWSLRAG
ncbi:MAG TPA: hypothetical protein DDZ40_11390 [Deltaproteobacteria bacterium]|nr:hypothetical protein [Deltaproteobacteria bacterium]